jgi:mycothiol synthase
MLQASPISLRRLPFEHGAEALRLVARAWPQDERAAQLAAISALATSGRASELVLVEARRDRQLVGASLAQCLPGKAAVVWSPQIAEVEDLATQQLLLQELHRFLSEAGVQLAQALVDEPSVDVRAALQAAGYIHAGDLSYMAALADCFPHRPPAAPLSYEPYQPDQPDRLERLVAATYGGSLDCPLVDGMRETADVLAGYRAVGVFRSDLWLIVRGHDRDVGCLLLADHPDENQLEIVYLGLVPAARGRGWGRLITAQALWMARQCRRSRVVLAVDATNWPAIAIYVAVGFAGWDRRSVLVRSFRGDATSAAPTT